MQQWKRLCLLLTDQYPPCRRLVAPEDPQLRLPQGEEEENASSLCARLLLLLQLFLNKMFYGCLNFMCLVQDFDNLLENVLLGK